MILRLRRWWWDRRYPTAEAIRELAVLQGVEEPRWVTRAYERRPGGSQG